MKAVKSRIRCSSRPRSGYLVTRPIVSFLLLLCLSLPLPQTHALAAELYGVVFYPEGAPATRVGVQVADREGRVLQETATGSQGGYAFSGLSPGVHILRCQGQEWEVYVEPGHSRFDLYLR